MERKSINQIGGPKLMCSGILISQICLLTQQMVFFSEPKLLMFFMYELLERKFVCADDLVIAIID